MLPTAAAGAVDEGGEGGIDGDVKILLFCIGSSAHEWPRERPNNQLDWGKTLGEEATLPCQRQGSKKKLGLVTCYSPLVPESMAWDCRRRRIWYYYVHILPIQ